MTMLGADVLYLTVRELGQRLRSGQFTSVALTESYLERSHRLGPELRAYVTITDKLALEQAKRADDELRAGHDRGPLHGIPYAAKDLVAVPDYPTTWGAKPYANRVIDSTATIIARLDRAGAVLVGKAAMIELAGGLGYRTPAASFTGAAINPWNKNYWTCGSSSGPGAIVAAAMAAFAIGSETNGSILCPSSSCGVAGLRPTYGRVSRHGAMALAYTMDKLGPLARSANDLALVMAGVAGHDPRDPTSLPETQARFVASSVETRMRRPLRIGWLSQPWRSSTPEIAAAVSKAMGVMRKNGATVAEIDLPSGPWEQTGSVTVEAEASTAFENLIRSGKVAELADPSDRIGGYVRQEVRASDYLRAQRVRRILERKMRDLYRQFDVIAAPGTGGTAPPLHPNPEEENRRRRSFTERPAGRSSPTTVGNLCGLPAVAVPCGFSSKEGLPIGLQFMGPALGETAVLAAAALYQRHTDWHKRRPPIS
jgi:aspartyl-tRNA(Asn)/glutamyl-tRNA(Gln) amidotransferase subunit A